MPPLTVIISYRENEADIHNLLQSFSILDDISASLLYQIILVDSNSMNAFPWEEYSLPITYVFNPKGTLTSSLNKALGYVSTEWCLILDADTQLVAPDTFQALTRYPESEPYVVVPRSVDINFNEQDCFDIKDTIVWNYLLTSKLHRILFKGYFRMKSKLLSTSSIFDVKYFWNMAVFLNSKALDNFRYDESFYVWACDFDLSKKLRHLKVNICCDPELAVIHYGGSSEGGHESIERMKKVIYSEWLYINKNYKNLSSLIHLLSLFMRVLLMLTAAPFTGFRKSMRKLRLLSYHFSLIS